MTHRLRILNLLIRRAYSSSTLFVNGREASNNFIVLRPFLDFEERVQNRQELQRNMKLRHMDLELDKIVKHWINFKYLEGDKNKLENAKAIIQEKIIKLTKDQEKNSGEIKNLITQIQSVKTDLRNLKNKLYDIEEQAAFNALSLPNFLHIRTPHHKEVEICMSQKKPTDLCMKDHMQLAFEKDLIEYTNTIFCYMKGELALFEQAVLCHASETLLNSSFMQFSNYDFSRSIVVDGCSFPDHSNLPGAVKTYILEDIHNENDYEINRLHLTGSSSIYAFMSYFTRHSLKSSHFPLRFFNTGQKYVPKPLGSPSLFNFSKKTCTEIFIATTDNNRLAEQQLDNAITLITTFYQFLNCHFRLVYLPAFELAKHESLRISVQMFSPHLQRYVEVGHCSAYENYLSKRLLFNYDENKVKKFPKVISGTLLSVQPLVACMLEYQHIKESKNLFSNLIEKYVV